MMDVMLDLETWGTEPGCDIRSIGACVFDPVTGFVPGVDAPALPRNQFYIATGNPVYANCPHCLARTLHDGEDCHPIYTYPLHRDPQTAQWWSEQSDEAQAALADPVDLREALSRFDSWLRQVTEAGYECEPVQCRLWSHGPAFDPPILAAAYRAVGLPVPWHYRAPRDTRTAFDMAGIADHSAWLDQHPGPLGVPHHALDDAICQARAVCGAYDRLREIHDLLDSVRRP